MAEGEKRMWLPRQRSWTELPVEDVCLVTVVDEVAAHPLLKEESAPSASTSRSKPAIPCQTLHLAHPSAPLLRPLLRNVAAHAPLGISRPYCMCPVSCLHLTPSTIDPLADPLAMQGGGLPRLPLSTSTALPFQGSSSVALVLCGRTWPPTPGHQMACPAVLLWLFVLAPESPALDSGKAKYVSAAEQHSPFDYQEVRPGPGMGYMSPPRALHSGGLASVPYGIQQDLGLVGPWRQLPGLNRRSPSFRSSSAVRMPPQPDSLATGFPVAAGCPVACPA
eukprot:gene2798-556_t